MRFYEGDFAQICRELHWHLMQEADVVDTGHWQSLKNVPHTATRELFRVCVETHIPEHKGLARLDVDPNVPWAEDHFKERVAGQPTNPGDQYMNWPWYDPTWKAQHPDAKFSHTYQERFWPQYASDGRTFRESSDRGLYPIPETWGIRYRYGDLNDLLALLRREPTTRQAYLPIWFPEDTGAHHGERVPCTLGYHFMLRGGLLHITYHIRSCDFLRYFRDDVYMAMRLCQWVLARLKPSAYDEASENQWRGVVPGILQMNISSLHVFEGDMPRMRREAPAKP